MSWLKRITSTRGSCHVGARVEFAPPLDRHFDDDDDDEDDDDDYFLFCLVCGCVDTAAGVGHSKKLTIGCVPFGKQENA